MRRLLLVGIITSLFLGFGNHLSAQTDTEFWFVKPNITPEHTNRSFKIVFTTQEFAANVTIQMPAEPAFTPIDINIPAHTTFQHQVTDPSAEFTIMNNSTLIDQLSLPPSMQDNIGNKAILVTSTSPITAYLTQTADNNSDIYTLKGRNGIGTEFIIPFQDFGSNQRSSYRERAFSSLDIIGIEDGTIVEITPPSTKDVYRSGTYQNQLAPYNITLNRGQVYTCAPGWDPTVKRNNTANSGWWGIEGAQHLGGIIVKVVSGQGVAVIKKDDSVRKGTEIFSEGGWDIIGDQWVPYKKIEGISGMLGTEYAAMRGGSDDGWEYIYATAPENNTRIWYGNNIDTTLSPANAIINRGEQLGIQFDNGMFAANIMEIISNKPLSVLHVSGIGKEVGGAVLPPIDKCTGSTNISFTRDMPWTMFINIMVRVGAENSFLIDGVVRNDIIDPASFVPVGSSGDWLATQIYYGYNDFSDFIVGETYTISNSENVFHMGVMNGNVSGGSRYGYFSDFSKVSTKAQVLVNNLQPSGVVRACDRETLQLYATGGTDFFWWPSVGLSDPTIANPIALVEDFRTYYVQISGSCGGTDTSTVTIELYQTPIANFDLDSEEGCAPHVANLTNTSDVATDYIWNFGDGEETNYENVAHAYTNQTNTNVDYTISLIAINGACSDTVEKVITIHPAIESNITEKHDVTCFGSGDGSAIVTPIGGMQPYTYFWNNGGTNSTLNNLSGGDYSVTVTDVNGCSSISDTSIIEPSQLVIGLDLSNVSCFGMDDGNISVATPASSYLWNNGAITQSISNLSPGDYSVTVTDVNGCSSISDTLIIEPSQFVISLDLSNVSCFGMDDGNISVATPATSYLWNNGATTQSISNLSPGDYTVTATNSDGCFSTLGANIQEPLELKITTNSISNLICASSNNGFIDLSVNGGVPPYSYLWSNDYILEDINNLEEGNYTVTVADVNNCIANRTFLK
ncbi:MAG: hypothetical protein JEY96_18745 [Bacteroidales bacterium]|nr:hypothetical protein [Bacteroidales bacterium]